MVKYTFLKILTSSLSAAAFSVMFFFIGLAASEVVALFLGQLSIPPESTFPLLVLLCIIFLAIYVSLRFGEVITLLRNQNLSVDVTYASTDGQDKELYRVVKERIFDAKHSIAVIGMYRPNHLSIREGRANYYTLINDVVNLRARANKPFSYLRIVQVENVVPGLIRSDQIDAVTFAHCQQILNWREKRGALTADVKQMPNILGALSFLIIDDEFFALVIPDTGKTDTENIYLRGLQLALNFNDADHQVTEPMKRFFERLFAEAEQVRILQE